MTEDQQVKTAIEEAKPALKNIMFNRGVIMPTDYEDVMRFAGLVHASGLAPKSFDTAPKVAIGILMNMELGRPIITGLQDLAVINGRCRIFGDAKLAKVMASGLVEEGYPIETETGQPYKPGWRFTFTIRRKGRPEKTGVWTWEEAIRAGFDNPQTRDGRDDIWSPWRRFTKRMMQWKSKGWVLNDEFGDILQGLPTVEDSHDYIELERDEKNQWLKKGETIEKVLEEGRGVANYELKDLSAETQAQMAKTAKEKEEEKSLSGSTEEKKDETEDQTKAKEAPGRDTANQAEKSAVEVEVTTWDGRELLSVDITPEYLDRKIHFLKSSGITRFEELHHNPLDGINRIEKWSPACQLVFTKKWKDKTGHEYTAEGQPGYKSPEPVTEDPVVDAEFHGEEEPPGGPPGHEHEATTRRTWLEKLGRLKGELFALTGSEMEFYKVIKDRGYSAIIQVDRVDAAEKAVFDAVEAVVIKARKINKKEDCIVCPLKGENEEPVPVSKCKTDCPRGSEGVEGGPRCEPYEEYLYLLREEKKSLDESGG